MKLHEREDSLPWLWLAVLLGLFVLGGYVEHAMPMKPDAADSVLRQAQHERNVSTQP